MKSRAFKRVWGKPWDFSYLLKLEQYKIREMITYFKNHHHLSNWKYVVREMQICDRLISIVLEEDVHYRGWLNTCYGDVETTQVPFPVYVNTKNYKRFLPMLKNLHQDNLVLYNGILISLRQQKALYLYNKIRSYCMQKWWD